jgi:hypothetical protein
MGSPALIGEVISMRARVTGGRYWYGARPIDTRSAADQRLGTSIAAKSNNRHRANRQLRRSPGEA